MPDTYQTAWESQTYTGIMWNTNYIFILVVSCSIVEPCGTWTPGLRISLLSRCPVPVQHAQVRRQWRPRFHHASKLAKIGQHCCYMPLPRGSSAFTPLTPCHHLSFFFVIASQDYRILSKIVVHWSTRQSSQSIQSILGLSLFHWCIAVPSPWCSCLKEPPELTCQKYRQRQILTSYTGTKAATVGSVICHHHSLRSQHFIYKWILRSQHAQCIHWYFMENNSIYQRKWQGNANWTPSTLIWTTVFFHSFPIFSKPPVAKVSQPLELQRFSCSATDFYDLLWLLCFGTGKLTISSEDSDLGPSPELWKWPWMWPAWAWCAWCAWCGWALGLPMNSKWLEMTGTFVASFIEKK